MYHSTKMGHYASSRGQVCRFRHNFSNMLRAVKPAKYIPTVLTRRPFFFIFLYMSSYFSIIDVDTGFMPFSSAVGQAQAMALARTAQLASTQSVDTDAILASADATTLAQMPPALLAAAANRSNPNVNLLRAAANTACASGDMGQCSVLNEQLGALQAASTCPGGRAYQALQAQKQRGSIDKWFHHPAFVVGTHPTTPDVAAVAVSLAAIQ